VSGRASVNLSALAETVDGALTELEARAERAAGARTWGWREDVQVIVVGTGWRAMGTMSMDMKAP